MQIITAGLAPTGANTGTVDDRTFLRQMYAAGLANYQGVAQTFIERSVGSVQARAMKRF